MDDGSRLPLLGLLILILLVAVNGIFYGFAAAAQNLSENEVDKSAKEGNKKALLLQKLLREPAVYVNAIPLAVTTSGIVTGVFLVPFLAHIFKPYIAYFPAVVLLSALCVILLASLGILTFRRVGTCRPQKFALRYAGFIYVTTAVLRPLTALVTWIARMAASLFGVSAGEKQDAVTEEEIIDLLDEAHEQGVLKQSEAEMIQNIIAFDDTAAGDIMTHRTSITAFDMDDLLKDVVDQMLEEDNSRYPVYGEDLDDIRGILHYKDALKFMTQNPWAKYKTLKELPGLIRKAAFVPETGSIAKLFGTMQTKKAHMAVVVDEYGQTCGIVTMEDILEEIVGDILDEFDEEESFIHILEDGTLLIDGMADLDDVGEKLGIDFEDQEMETINGYLTGILGHIPSAEDLDKELLAEGWRFKILSLGNRTIGRVRAEKIRENEKTTENKGESEVCQDIQNSRI